MSELFHFRVSDPASNEDDTGTYEYDPEAQVGSWTGSASAVAAGCTNRLGPPYFPIFNTDCEHNAYTGVCIGTGWGGFWTCD